MSLNIKNPETCRLAEELAALTNENKTQAITIALQERLERERERLAEVDRSLEGWLRWKAERRKEIADMHRRLAPHLRPAPSSQELIDSLYDEHGLPK